MGVDPCQAQRREREEPTRVGPCLCQHQQFRGEPDQREVQPPVGHDHACDAEREQQDDDHHPATACAEGSRVRGARQEAKTTQHDPVDVEGRGTKGPVEGGQCDFGAPLVGHPPAMRLGVGERVEPDDAVMGQHPLAGGQRPELVVRERMVQGDGGDEADAEGEPDQFDGTLRETAAGYRLRPFMQGSRGGAGRRHIACLDGPDARLHYSPLVPDLTGTPAPHRTTPAHTPPSQVGCDPVALLSRTAVAPVP